MKKALLSIATVFLFAEGQAQISLTESSFPNQVTAIPDTFAYISSGHDSTWNTHLNYLWNLNSISYTSQRRWVGHVAETGYSYGRMVLDTINVKTHSVQNGLFIQTVEHLTKIVPVGTVDSGITEYAIKIPASVYSLSGFTGAVATADSLWMNAQTAPYYDATVNNNLSRRVMLKFPATYNQMQTVAWTNHVQDTMHGRITYTVQGWIDTPFHKKAERLDQRSIVGWGKMRLRKPTGYTPIFSDTFEVIQVRCSLQMRDFYYIGNNVPIDNTVLPEFGAASQGASRTYYFDEYYRAGYVEPLLTVRFTDANYNNSLQNMADVHLRGLSPSDVAILTNMSNINVYPNPVTGGTFNVDINSGATQGNWNYTLLNATGQTIKTGVVGQGNNKVTLPNNIPAGNYFMSLENGEEKVAKTITVVE